MSINNILLINERHTEVTILDNNSISSKKIKDISEIVNYINKDTWVILCEYEGTADTDILYKYIYPKNNGLYDYANILILNIMEFQFGHDRNDFHLSYNDMYNRIKNNETILEYEERYTKKKIKLEIKNIWTQINEIQKKERWPRT